MCDKNWIRWINGTCTKFDFYWRKLDDLRPNLRLGAKKFVLTFAWASIFLSGYMFYPSSILYWRLNKNTQVLKFSLVCPILHYRKNSLDLTLRH